MKRRAAARRRGRTAPGAASRWWAGVPDAVRVGTLRLVASTLVVALLCAVASRLVAAAKANEAFVVRPSVVLSEDGPCVLPAALRRRVEEAVARLPPVSIFAPSFRERVARAVEAASPWVENVLQVEKLYPNRARVRLRLRTPEVFVDLPDARVWIDENGLVLDRTERGRDLRFGVRVWRVEGARPAGAVRVGRPFPDPEVRCAALVAQELDELPEPLAATLRAAKPTALMVRVGDHGGGRAPGEVHVRTLSGTLLEWGRARRGPRGASELTVERKIAHLRAVLGRFDGLAGLEEVRLNFGVPYVRAVGGALEFLSTRDGEGTTAPADGGP